jgi:hypothetical protein
VATCSFSAKWLFNAAEFPLFARKSGSVAVGLGFAEAFLGFAMGMREGASRSAAGASTGCRRSAASKSFDGLRRSGFGLHARMSKGARPPSEAPADGESGRGICYIDDLGCTDAAGDVLATESPLRG